MKSTPSATTEFPSARLDTTARAAPIYALITDKLRKAIQAMLITPGTVLLEGHVAEILGSTRTPVRQALQELESEGLVSRFDGRGVIVGGADAEPKRVTLTAVMLGMTTSDEPVRKTHGWESIYEEVERDVVNLSVFGNYRVSELEMARNFKVGRMVAHDVLLRLERLGLVEKDERSRWVVRPLDAERINHLYELRWLLEPAALRSAISSVTSDETDDMMSELRAAMRAYPAIGRTELDKLEDDFHVKLLSKCSNEELLQGLARTRCLLTLSKHVLGVSAPMPKRDPFMSEHLAVLKAVAGGNITNAQDLLRKHLEGSCSKVSLRALHVRNNLPIPKLPYVS